MAIMMGLSHICKLRYLDVARKGVRGGYTYSHCGAQRSILLVSGLLRLADIDRPPSSPHTPEYPTSAFQRLVGWLIGWLLGYLTSQQHASASQGRSCSDSFTCCHTEIEVADQTFHLTHSQYTDTGPTSPSTDPITPGAWQGSHWSANFVTGMARPRKNPVARGVRTRDLPLSRRTP